MIDYQYADLFKKDGVKKDLILDFGDFQITNEKLYFESFELSESLCSQKSLQFGCCESSLLKFKCRNEFGQLTNKKFDAYIVLNDISDDAFKIGTYKVNSDSLSGDKKYVNITAYDDLFDIVNSNVAEWYNSLVFPITQKEFRDSFFEYFGIVQEDIVLIQDEMYIEQTVNTTELSGRDVLFSICELNGVFGSINRQGVFTYVSLGKYEGAAEIETNQYMSVEYEDFETLQIGKLQIRQEKNDIGTIVGEGENTYIVEDNFLVYGKSSGELENIASKLIEKISGVYYRPARATIRGNLCLEVGDPIVVQSRNKEIKTYILERTTKGIQTLKDSIQAQGTLKHSEKVNSTQRQLNQLRGKTNSLERTVEQTVSRITDVEKQTETAITQTAESLRIEIQGISESTNNLREDVNKNTEDIDKTTYQFGTEDFTVAKEGEEIETHISYKGMSVQQDGKDVLVANNKGVKAEDLHATTYLIVGRNSRLEDYQENRTACFWIGG